jgi:hypothetical protein
MSPCIGVHIRSGLGVARSGPWRQYPGPFTARSETVSYGSYAERLLCFFELLGVPDLLKSAKQARRSRLALQFRNAQGAADKGLKQKVGHGYC